jgi:hypothetical protein
MSSWKPLGRRWEVRGGHWSVSVGDALWHACMEQVLLCHCLLLISSEGHSQPAGHTVYWSVAAEGVHAYSHNGRAAGSGLGGGGR